MAMAEEACIAYASHHGAFKARQFGRKGRRLSARLLLGATEQALWSYLMEAPRDVSCDDHANRILPSMHVVHEHDVIFVKQVLYGCCRYKQLTNTIMSKLLQCKPGLIQPQDQHLFAVLSYLILIRLEELTFPNLRRLILSQNAQKVLPFLQFIFTANELALCKEEWLKFYDADFIKVLINGVGTWQNDAKDLIKSVEEKVVIKDRRGQIKPTRTKPFKLSANRGDVLKEEEEQLVCFKSKPAPKWTGGPSKWAQRLEIVYGENRRRKAQFYANTKNRPFRLRTLERPSNLNVIKKEVEEKKKMETLYIPPQVNPIPPPPSKEVKLNAAAVLREHFLYLKQIEADRQRIENYEVELRDDSDYKTWQNEVRSEMETAQALDLQFKKAAALLTVEAVAEAKLAKVKENQETAANIRVEGHRLLDMKAEASFINEFTNRILREDVLKDRDASKKAAAKVAEARKLRAMKIQNQSAQNESDVALRRNIELKMRQELVRQLHDLERIKFVKKFDPTTTGGHDLLEEMSVEQVKQHLIDTRLALKRQEESRRAAIAASKIEKRNHLFEKALMVKKMRELAHVHFICKKEAKKRLLMDSLHTKELSNDLSNELL